MTWTLSGKARASSSLSFTIGTSELDEQIALMCVQPCAQSPVVTLTAMKNTEKYRNHVIAIMQSALNHFSSPLFDPGAGKEDVVAMATRCRVES